MSLSRAAVKAATHTGELVGNQFETVGNPGCELVAN